MPQADLVTFQSLTIWTTVLIIITLNLSYYFVVPFISVIFKIDLKNKFTFYCLFRNSKINIIKVFEINKSLKFIKFYDFSLLIMRLYFFKNLKNYKINLGPQHFAAQSVLKFILQIRLIQTRIKNNTQAVPYFSRFSSGTQSNQRKPVYLIQKRYIKSFRTLVSTISKTIYNSFRGRSRRVNLEIIENQVIKVEPNKTSNLLNYTGVGTGVVGLGYTVNNEYESSKIFTFDSFTGLEKTIELTNISDLEKKDRQNNAIDCCKESMKKYGFRAKYYFDSPNFWRIRTEYFDQLVDLRKNLKPESFIDQEKIQEFLVDLDAHIEEIRASIITNSTYAKSSSHKSLISMSKRSIHTSSNLIVLKSNKHAKVNFKDQLILISKRSFRIESNTERLERERSDKVSFDFYSGKNIKKRKIINNSLLSSKEDTKLNFLNKILTNNTGQLIFTILSWLLLAYIFITLLELFNKIFYLDTSFVEHITTGLTRNWHSPELKEDFLNISIFLALEDIKYNEYSFYIRPDTVEFLQSKIEYQKTLKTFSNTLYWEDFENKREGLKFLTTFYEHYFKVVELNKASIISHNLNK
jgi:hypothetical protein